jgi:hypothetical protein
MKNLGFLVTFCMNLHLQSRSRSQPKNFSRLRPHQKVAAPPAPTPQHCYYAPTEILSEKKFTWDMIS